MQVDYYRFSIRGWFILPYLLLFPVDFRLTSGHDGNDSEPDSYQIHRDDFVFQLSTRTPVYG